MKKLIFLLIAAIALVVFLPAAEVAYPPGANTIEAAMFGIGVDNYIVTPDTALVFISVNYAEQASLQIAMANMNIINTKALRSQDGYVTDRFLISLKLPMIGNAPDYNLLC